MRAWSASAGHAPETRKFFGGTYHTSNATRATALFYCERVNGLHEKRVLLIPEPNAETPAQSPVRDAMVTLDANPNALADATNSVIGLLSRSRPYSPFPCCQPRARPR